MTEPTSPDVTELCACPFCGGAAEWCLGEHGDGTPWRYIACADCEAMGPAAGRDDNEGHQVAAWNRRAPNLASRQEIERLTEELEIERRAHTSTSMALFDKDAALRLSAQGREDMVEAYRQALEAAGYYIDRLRTAHAGRPVRDMEEAGAAFYRLSGEALALQPKGGS